MRVLDSRRLTGPNLLLDGPGAILDVALDGVDPARAVAAWRAELAPLLSAVGWKDATLVARAHATGLNLAFSAPIDTLYAATEVNEEAWRAAARTLEGAGADAAAESRDAIIARLRAAIESERKPWLHALAREAHAHGVTLLADDRRVSVGLGIGSRAWPEEETSSGVLERVPWSELADVPTALVTGTNGKTTTVRLLGAIATAAGLTAGVTTTDCVTVGDEVVATGDYSGPNGARTVLRDRRVEIAMLEVARGGILRRGLALPRATAALITNVASDHLGEFGIHDLESLADVKMVVAKAVGPAGHVVLNADDPRLLARGRRLSVPVVWFTLDPRHPVVVEHLARGGKACVLDGDRLLFAHGHASREIIRIPDLPLAWNGAARHNVANALAAIGVAMALGLPDAAIRAGLARFGSDRVSNPGRANVWRIGGVTAIVDYAHNPHGLAALAGMTAAMPARRRGIVIGQAGDRDDDAIHELARTVWAMGPAHVFIKEMETFLRGRERGVVPAMIDAELRRLGAGGALLSHWESELEAVRASLDWAREGDLLLLTTHAQRDEVIALLDRLDQSDWEPGQPLPPPSAAAHRPE
jgi:UDP-N-acetylmuramyl tripeptide synthase